MSLWGYFRGTKDELRILISRNLSVGADHLISEEEEEGMRGWGCGRFPPSNNFFPVKALLHCAMFATTYVATPLRDKLLQK